MIYNVTEFRSLVLLLVFFTVSSCGPSSSLSSQNLPEWIDNPNAAFSENSYLMAVGSGSSLKQAQNDSKAALSQIFKAEINAEETLVDDFREFSKNGEYSSSGTSQLLQVTQIGSNQDLINVQILKSTQLKDGTFYALAGMDRNESARIYRQEIANNELKINELESSAEQEGSMLQKMILLKKSLTLARVNENLAKQLRIIKPGSTDIELHGKTVSRIEQNYRAVQKNLGVYIQSDSASETIISAVAGVFQNSGFSLIDSPSDALLTVNINYASQEVELNRKGVEFVKWDMIIEIEDKQANRAFNTFMTEGRDGAITYADAEKRADFSARKKIQKDFKSFLNNQLLSIK